MTSLSVNIFSLYKNAQSGYSHQTKRNIKLHETDNYKYRFLKTQNVFPSPLSTCSIYWSPSFSSFSWPGFVHSRTGHRRHNLRHRKLG